MTVALGFLTRLPVPHADWSEGDLGRARAWFPLVGVVVAACGTLARWLLGLALPDLVGVIVGVLVMIAVTGAFHEDGLADTADGLWGGANVEQRLAIMRDSRIGTYGTVALVGSIALRVAILAPLDVTEFLGVASVGHVLGRFSILPLSAVLAPVSDSSAALLREPTPASGWVVASATVLIVLGGAVGLGGWAPASAALATTAACLVVIDRKLGGVTGDVLGASNQVVHIASMAATAAVIR